MCQENNPHAQPNPAPAENSTLSGWGFRLSGRWDMILNWAKPGLCRCPCCAGQRIGARINPKWFATVVVRGLSTEEFARLCAMTDAAMLGP